MHRRLRQHSALKRCTSLRTVFQLGPSASGWASGPGVGGSHWRWPGARPSRALPVANPTTGSPGLPHTSCQAQCPCSKLTNRAATTVTLGVPSPEHATPPRAPSPHSTRHKVYRRLVERLRVREGVGRKEMLVELGCLTVTTNTKHNRESVTPPKPMHTLKAAWAKARATTSPHLVLDKPLEEVRDRVELPQRHRGARRGGGVVCKGALDGHNTAAQRE